MKKLSKIVALLLAGAMAMVMLTACSGGGNTGSNLKEDSDAEAKVLSKYSTSVANNKELKDEAEKSWTKNSLYLAVSVAIDSFLTAK